MEDGWWKRGDGSERGWVVLGCICFGMGTKQKNLYHNDKGFLKIK